LIYFIQPTDGGAIKIGFTDDLGQRIKALESHYGCSLALLHAMPGGRDVERELHGRFSRLRLGKTEQFRPAAELLAFINRPLLVHPDPDAVEAIPVARATVPLTVKGSPEWREWVEKVAEHNRTDLSTLIDAALVKFAREIGVPDPPPKR
jgi:hypothetical protein